MEADFLGTKILLELIHNTNINKLQCFLHIFLSEKHITATLLFTSSHCTLFLCDGLITTHKDICRTVVDKNMASLFCRFSKKKKKFRMETCSWDLDPSKVAGTWYKVQYKQYTCAHSEEPPVGS